jgi:murein DD-endopeptidase MepM/ murein hydrolase activator NlpD
VSQPQLHFELRKGSRPVDPTKFMSNAQASTD